MRPRGQYTVDPPPESHHAYREVVETPFTPPHRTRPRRPVRRGVGGRERPPSSRARFGHGAVACVHAPAPLTGFGSRPSTRLPAGRPSQARSRSVGILKHLQYKLASVRDGGRRPIRTMGITQVDRGGDSRLQASRAIRDPNGVGRIVAESMGRWLQDSLLKLSRKSHVIRALQYALCRWPALLGYAADPWLEIDNNAAKRALRAGALGGKNYMYVSLDTRRQRAAAVYSLIGTAKLHGIEPKARLPHVRTRIADHPVHRVDELLPCNLADSLIAGSRPAA